VTKAVYLWQNPVLNPYNYYVVAQLTSGDIHAWKAPSLAAAEEKQAEMTPDLGYRRTAIAETTSREAAVRWARSVLAWPKP